MKIRINPHKWICSFFQYGVALAFMLNCRSMWLEIDTMRTWFPYFILLILAISTVGCIFTSRLFSSKKMVAAFISTLAIFIYLEMFQIIHYSKIIQFQRLVIAVSCIVFLVIFTKDDTYILEILLKYRNIIVVVSVVSLFFWGCGSLLGLISPTGTIRSTWSSTTNLVNVASYYNIYFEPQNIRAFGILPIMVRNSACFTEGPMAALNFSLALIISLMLDKKNSKWSTIILVVSIVSTFSVSGYVVMFIALGYSIISNTPKQKLIKLMKLFCIPVVIVVFAVIGYAIVLERLQTSSGLTRIDDFVIGFKAWKNNIIIGNGFENYNVLQTLMGGRANIGFSNSVMQLLSDGGVYFFMFILVAMVREIKFCFFKAKFKELCFALCFIGLYIFLIATYQYVNIFIFTWFLCKNNKRYID